jgi:hypothetical protein
MTMDIPVKPVVEKQHTGILARLRTWVKQGLIEFWRSALPEDQVVIPLLRAAIEQDWPEKGKDSWESNTAKLIKQLKANSSLPLSRLLQDYQLHSSEIFILALLGELQADHVVNMTVTQLQLPDRSTHLSVHLAVALIEELFPGQNSAQHAAFTMLESTLVRDHLISLSSDAPLPLCKLQMPAVVWAVLCGRTPPWPGCRYFDAAEGGRLAQASVDEAHKIARLLQPVIEQTAEHASATLSIRGVPNSGRLALARIVAQDLHLKPLSVPEKLWSAQSALPTLCAYAGWLAVIQPDTLPGQTFQSKTHVHNRFPIAVLLGMDGAVDGENLIEIETACPTQAEREQAWSSHLHNPALARQLGQGAMLSLNSIRELAGHAQQLAARQNLPVALEQVQEARRYYGAEKLRTLAEPVHKTVQRDAMAFTQAVQASLDLLLLRSRKREFIWRNLGKTLKVTPTPGVRALFVGESGTGKTLAASYIATALGSPLYRVDLSSVMNKYIGESEKNLSQLLDYAAAGDVVLLFDEADSLFGSRSEGKETGERYANMLTNFLLTRIENHPGVVILTTNGKERIDNAFNRRIDVEVDFPLPGYEERLSLWRSHLGEQQAISQEAFGTIASYCDFTGGQVRNAVLAAATCAEDEQIGMHDLLRGILLEYDKLGRKVPKAVEQLHSH